MIAHVVPLDPNSEELFKEYEGLVNFTVWKFVEKHGGDFEDLLGDAYLYYMEAVKAYDGRVSLQSNISCWIWDRLLDQWRTKANRRNRVGPFLRSDSPRWLEQRAVDRHSEEGWTVEEFLEELTEDARIVVRLCVDTPAEIKRTAEDKGGTPRNYRSTVRQWLESVGWSYQRIRESFEEIKTALK